jgi:TatD DNase family protein
MIVDTHVHLESKKFEKDLDRVLQRARDAGVDRLVSIGDDLFSSRRTLALARRSPFIRATAGVHPGHARPLDADAERELRQLAADPKTVAIGEIGLDFHYPGYNKELQLHLLARQAAIASELGLPMVLHCRDAYEALIEFFQSRADITSRGVVHCFSGTAEQARRLIEMGFFLGVGGAITYPGADGLRQAIREVGLGRVVVETDAPYLPPQCKRGRRNEPSYLKFTVHALAELTGLAYADVARMTTANAVELYDLPEDREAALAYALRDRLYLNVTNRCTNDCRHCERRDDHRLLGHSLKLEGEPTAGQILAAIERPERFQEFVICGLGEPTLRLDVVLELARRLKADGRRVRLNTNGHGSLIHGRDITPKFAGLLDAVAITMNAHDEATYNEISCPADERRSFEAMLDFARRVREFVPDVRMKVVALPGVDVEACRRIAEDELRVRFQVREPRAGDFAAIGVRAPLAGESNRE